MSLVSATLVLYRDSLADAARALGRSAWAVVALVIGTVAVGFASRQLAPYGLGGGLVLWFIEAFLVAWYLSLVAIGVEQRRRVFASDLRDNLGKLFGVVRSVMFVFWMLLLILAFSPGWLTIPVVLVCALLFNPVPEMVYLEQSDSLGLIGDSMKFLQENWPEWLVGQLIGAGFLLAWTYVFQGGLNPALTLWLLQSFGPFFGFILGGNAVVFDGTPREFVGSIVLLAFTHFFLLFRGHLYKRLAGSSRRGRAWRARM